jgi:acetylornithine deacetylase
MLWEAHQDTVSLEGMTVAPLAASVREGRVYGRGACDVKGPMACMLTALRQIASGPAGERPNVIMACCINEECGFTGARALASIWQASGEASPSATAVLAEGGLTLAELRALRPAAAIIAEPTDMHVVAAHRGVVRWQCVVHGRAAHSSRPERGANAIYAMVDVVRQIEEFHGEILAKRTPDALCGPPSACVTTIQGGLGANTVPDRAVIDVDRRLPPGEEPQAAFEELTAYLDDRFHAANCRIEHRPPWMQSRGLASGQNLAWAKVVRRAAQSGGADSQIVGVPYGTNAASIATAGIPSVVFGPGSIEQAHTADEWIAVDELQRAVDVFYGIASGA